MIYLKILSGQGSRLTSVAGGDLGMMVGAMLATFALQDDALG